MRDGREENKGCQTPLDGGSTGGGGSPDANSHLPAADQLAKGDNLPPPKRDNPPTCSDASVSKPAMFSLFSLSPLVWPLSPSPPPGLLGDMLPFVVDGPALSQLALFDGEDEASVRSGEHFQLGEELLVELDQAT